MSGPERPKGRKATLVWDVPDAEPHVFTEVFEKIAGLAAGDLPGSVIQKVTYEHRVLTVELWAS